MGWIFNFEWGFYCFYGLWFNWKGIVFLVERHKAIATFSWDVLTSNLNHLLLLLNLLRFCSNLLLILKLVSIWSAGVAAYKINYLAVGNICVNTLLLHGFNLLAEADWSNKGVVSRCLFKDWLFNNSCSNTWRGLHSPFYWLCLSYSLSIYRLFSAENSLFFFFTVFSNWRRFSQYFLNNWFFKSCKWDFRFLLRMLGDDHLRIFVASAEVMVVDCVSWLLKRLIHPLT